VLDSWGLRLVIVGFPLFTAGVVTGSIWAARLGNALGFALCSLLAWRRLTAGRTAPARLAPAAP